MDRKDNERKLYSIITETNLGKIVWFWNNHKKRELLLSEYYKLYIDDYECLKFHGGVREDGTKNPNIQGLKNNEEFIQQCFTEGEVEQVVEFLKNIYPAKTYKEEIEIPIHPWTTPYSEGENNTLLIPKNSTFDIRGVIIRQSNFKK
jgi:hypothetical protein